MDYLHQILLPQEDLISRGYCHQQVRKVPLLTFIDVVMHELKVIDREFVLRESIAAHFIMLILQVSLAGLGFISIGVSCSVKVGKRVEIKGYLDSVLKGCFAHIPTIVNGPSTSIALVVRS
jgi:hypothetical protein